VDRKRVSLALQGGASRGAYVWGVLDRLLEDGRLEIDGISGTSAGAINGALVAQGLDLGGPARARELLEAFCAGPRRPTGRAAAARSPSPACSCAGARTGARPSCSTP
jgi:NTE family protein